MSATPPLQLRAQRTLSEMLTFTFEFGRHHAADLLAVSWRAALVPLLAGVLYAALGGRQGIDGSEGTMATVFDLIVSIGIYAVSALGVAWVVLLDRYGERPTLSQAWAALRTSFPSLLGLTFGVAIAVGIVVSIVFYVAMAVGPVVFLALLPLLYLYTILPIAYVVIFAEKDTIGGSVVRASELVRGRFWQTAAYLVLLGLIVAVVVLGPALVAGAIIGAIGVVGGTGMLATTLSVLISLVTFVGLIAGSLLLAVATTLQYYNLVERETAGSLLQRIDQIGMEVK